MTERFRPAWVEIDLDAIRANVAAIGAAVAPAEIMAVVKADAYGHGAGEVAAASLDAGATTLGVALVEEGMALRAAGIDAPVLVLVEPPAAAAAAVVAAELTPIVYTRDGVGRLARAVAALGRTEPFPVHLKVDTGMHRVGVTPQDAPSLVDEIAASPELTLAGICTHLAVADELDNPYTDTQLDEFDALIAELAASGRDVPSVHAANSAGALGWARARYDLVRCGIAIYGIPPCDALGDHVPLRPALALKARVTHLQRLPAGARLSYGLAHTLEAPAQVATIPLGYADGVARDLGHLGGEVLIGGRRAPIIGTVTMDQLMVDVGDFPVSLGDEVVLIGDQGSESITATEWARRLDTIAYEIVSGIGSRVPRRYS